MDKFTKDEIERIESAFLSGDYCGNGALARANCKAILRDFPELEDYAFETFKGAYYSEGIKLNLEVINGEDMSAWKLLISDQYGVHIPQIFADKLSGRTKGASQWSIDTCAKGVEENELYLEAWNDILDNVEELDGVKGRLEQDGDLWFIPENPLESKLEEFREVIAALLDYPVIDEELHSKQEREEEEAAVENMVQYPGDLVRALRKLKVEEDAAEDLRDMDGEALKQAILSALSLACCDAGRDITAHEQNGAYIDAEKLAPYLIYILNLPYSVE